MMRWIKSLWRDEEGATMVEYALMLALIAIVAILVVTVLGTKVAATFDSAQQQLPAGGGQLPPTP